MDLSIIQQIAPTIATALGGPLAGVAMEILASKLGVPPDQVQKVIDSGKMTSEQLASVQVAEIELKGKAQELGLDFEKLSNDDRKSARDMESITRSWIPPILSIAVTFGFFGILSALMFGQVKANPEIEIMLGSLGTAWTMIVSFYFGSSASSQKKDELLHQSTPVQQ